MPPCRDADTGLATIRQQTMKQKCFVVSGTAVNIRKFKVGAATGYVVNLCLESIPSSDTDIHAETVMVPVLISSDLCASYLGTTTTLNQHTPSTHPTTTLSTHAPLTPQQTCPLCSSY